MDLKPQHQSKLPKALETTLPGVKTFLPWRGYGCVKEEFGKYHGRTWFVTKREQAAKGQKLENNLAN